MTIGEFPAHWQDQPLFYIEECGWEVFARPRGSKKTFRASRGHLEATRDRARIREMQRQSPGCGWSRRTSARQPAIDVEQREIQGKDGTIWLRRHAEALGFTTSLVPYGETPIALSPNVGFHIHCSGPDGHLPSRLLLPHVELKADGASISLPSEFEPERSWDPGSPPTLTPLLLPEWVVALVATTGAGRPKLSPPLPPEGPLGEQEATALRSHLAGRIIAKALSRGYCLADARNAARGLGWLAAEGRISTAYAHRALDRLGTELPAFGESGFSRSRLHRTLFATYERRCRRG
jgi:hypothetical protein